MIIRGTTPTHIFDLPLEVSKIADLRLSYAQEVAVEVEAEEGEAEEGAEPLIKHEIQEFITKKKEDVTLEDTMLKVTLSQEETLEINKSNNVVFVQLRIRTTDGAVLSSGIMNVEVWDTLNEDVLV